MGVRVPPSAPAAGAIVSLSRPLRLSLRSIHAGEAAICVAVYHGGADTTEWSHKDGEVLQFSFPRRRGLCGRGLLSAGPATPDVPPIAQRLAVPVAGVAAAITFLVLQVLQRIVGDS